MTTVYLTGTRYPGKALKAFLPEYLDLLAGRGETLLTTNKPGVDRLILQHCDKHCLPLQVIEFACDSGNRIRDRNRRTKPKSDAVQVQQVVSPSWQRFRYLADKADRMVFFHAGKTRGRCHGLTTLQAFEMACARRGVAGEQLIVQRQHAAWVSETELRNSPTIGVAHIYVYARFLPGIDGERHSLGYYRLETWRKIAGIVQPGEGRREIVMPHVKGKPEATLHMLHQALLALENQRPDRIIIHHCAHYLDNVTQSNPKDTHNPALVRQVRALLSQYPQVIWQREKQPVLQQQIGKPVGQYQAIWHHKRRMKAYKGLYQ